MRQKAWLVIGEYEEARGYAYIYLDEKPICDTNYKIVPCTITWEKPE